MHREQPGHALDHHLAGLVFGLTDQRNAPLAFAVQLRRIGDALHPFGAGARLASTTPADQKPCAPGLAILGERGRQLVIVTIELEAAIEFGPLAIRQPRQELGSKLRRPLPPFVAKARDG